MASALAGLKFSKAEKKVGAVSDPAAKRRDKFVEGVDIQLSLLADPSYTVTKKKYVDSVGTEVQVKPRPWHWIEGDAVKLQVKYGSRTVMLDGKNPTIEVGAIGNLEKTLVAVKNAAEGKELDGMLTALAARKKK